MPCYSPLKGWKDAETGGIVFRPALRGVCETMEVACGQCLGCRLDRSRMWAMRIVHEASLHADVGGNCFVTLTYRDKSECSAEQLRDLFFIPDDWSLHREHFVLFMKRLRKAFAPERIKFFMCGEYGSNCKHGIDLDRVACPLCNVGRPHYHACLFNCSFPDLVSYGSRNGDLRYTSPFLERVWKYGFVDVGDLNFDSAAYVARYCMKKVTGVLADDWYMQCDLDGVATWVEPEYCTMSRGGRHGHGLAYDWFKKFSSDVFPSDEVPVPGAGVFKGVPRYYEEIFKCTDALSLEEIKAVRLEFMRAHGDDYTPERLMDRYKVKKAQVALLHRSL